jgi:hypothetical protein
MLLASGFIHHCLLIKQALTAILTAIRHFRMIVPLSGDDPFSKSQ